ncbi:lipopolysaccharide biosynthesis protein [Negadavirga shengliensis]|uniref:Lipopolysaccharide biosynthesis protein n=1 Tax=Negadavirga shengliensis TaxID=1389218 RepID=A0ABV9T2I7_9BACT
MSPGLKNSILGGIFWTTIQLVVNRSFAFVIKLVLARILFPEEFGLIGMAVVFTSFIEVFNDLGFGAAIVQKKENSIDEKHYHTAFWTGIIWSIFLYICIITLVAPLAGNFYREPILEEIIPVLSLGILINPVNLVHKAQLTRDLNFRKLTYINNSSSIFAGCISLVLAFLNFGVWSLVFNSVATYAAALPMFFLATGWKPKLIWDNGAFKDIFGFGINTMGTQVFNNLINKFDYLVIGKLLSVSSLGVYTLAFTLTDTFRGQLMSVMNSVMYPIYGKKQDDKISLTKYYLKVVKYNSIVVDGIMMLLILFAEPIVLAFFGDKWIDTIIPLQILSLSVIFHMMVSSNTSLIRGMGKPGLEFRLQLFKSLVLYIPLIFFGTMYYGTTGAAMAILVNKIFSVIIAQYYLKKLLGISIGALFHATKPALLSLVIASCGGFISFNVLGIYWMVSAFVSILLYLISLYFMVGNDIKTELTGMDKLKTVLK